MRRRDLEMFSVGAALTHRNPPSAPNITINQQPLDVADAARLFGELETKAERRIVEAVTVGNTTFECVVQCWADCASDKTTWRAVFKLNGHSLTAEFSTQTRRANTNDLRQEMAFGLRDAVANKIATVILAEPFITMARAR